MPAWCSCLIPKREESAGAFFVATTTQLTAAIDQNFLAPECFSYPRTAFGCGEPHGSVYAAQGRLCGVA